MDFPGRNSLLLSLDINCINSFAYSVDSLARVDVASVYGLFKTSLTNSSIQITSKASARYIPDLVQIKRPSLFLPQSSYNKITVSSDFIYLVVGVSKGLGYLTALLLAEANVPLYTISRSKIDQLCSFHKHFSQDINSKLTFLSSLPSDSSIKLLYFSTPPIFNGCPEGFSAAYLASFIDMYCTTLQSLCIQLLDVCSSVSLFNPSTIAIGHNFPHLKEYSIAKECCELSLSSLAFYSQRFSYSTPRLDLMPTSQTDQLTDETKANLDSFYKHLRLFLES